MKNLGVSTVAGLKSARTLAIRVFPSNGLGGTGKSTFWLTISLVSAPDITSALISGRSSSSRAHKSAPFSRSISMSVIIKSILLV
jgi:hypothetical protein